MPPAFVVWLRPPLTRRTIRGKIGEGVSPEQAERYQRAAGIDVHGYKRVLAADEARKILRDHGSDHPPVTRQDFERLPQLTGSADQVFLSLRAGKLDRLISLKQEEGHTIVVEEIWTGRKNWP